MKSLNSFASSVNRGAPGEEARTGESYGHDGSQTGRRAADQADAHSARSHPRSSNSGPGPSSYMSEKAGFQKGNRIPDETFKDLKADVVVASLYQAQQKRLYVSPWNVGQGVVLKKCKNHFVCQPPDLSMIPDGVYDMVSQLNVSVAMTVSTPWVQSIISTIRSRDLHVNSIPMKDNLSLQVLQNLSDLPRCQKHHFAAFIIDAGVLVVWDDDPNNIIQRIAKLEADIVSLVWTTEEDDDDDESSKEVIRYHGDMEEGEILEVRPIRLTKSIMVALSLTLTVVCLGLGWRALALQIMLDGYYLRLLLLIVSPMQLFVSLFFFQTVIGNLFQILGPISAVNGNSRHYSGKAPPRLTRDDFLPHVTIQMPVYKEGLNAVIRPTIASLKAAISTYEMQGGTANIFVNDDGMQCIDPALAEARRDFYEEHSIGWVSRPPHNPNPKDDKTRQFVRKGKFKKASNMNYCLSTSNKIEDKLRQIERPEGWTQQDEEAAYEECLEEVIRESDGETWAGGNIRMGDYILLVDSDTRVPRDCLLDAVSEMEQSPEVAIIQHTSGVMTVTDSFFEQAVTWFTNLIYTSIKFCVANGDICPFVGHNAILSWRAIQDAASYVDPDDGREKYWSESHVSEDFDMALRLQSAGYILRFAAYSNGEFEEGVSLTVYDELARWEKYAFGCNELLFHPLRFWLVRGPFAPVFKQFISSKIHFYHKITILAYIGTYYAIGASWLLTLMNYFLTGWYFGLYDKYYIDSFAIYLSIIVVFPLAGNFALSILRYRLGEQNLLVALWTNFKWMPLFSIFLGGISLHVSKALLSHFFEIDIQWGATAKEVERVNFLTEVPKILRTFAGTFIFCIVCTALIVCGYYAFPYQWQIRYFASIYPLATVTVSHFCVPVLLNPALMKFTF